MDEFTAELIKLIHGSIPVIAGFFIGAVASFVGAKWYKRTKSWIQTVEIMFLLELNLLMFYNFLMGK
jgi:hypothetical protein